MFWMSSERFCGILELNLNSDFFYQATTTWTRPGSNTRYKIKIWNLFLFNISWECKSCASFYSRQNITRIWMLTIRLERKMNAKVISSRPTKWLRNTTATRKPRPNWLTIICPLWFVHFNRSIHFLIDSHFISFLQSPEEKHLHSFGKKPEGPYNQN